MYDQTGATSEQQTQQNEYSKQYGGGSGFSGNPFENMFSGGGGFKGGKEFEGL